MKKIQTLLITLILGTNLTYAQNVAINSDGSAPNASAMLDVNSTTKGFLAPRMTAVQRLVIASPATGLTVYQTDGTAGFYYYNGSEWALIGNASGATQWTTTESNIYYNTGNVGIGATTPAKLLQVGGNVRGEVLIAGIDGSSPSLTLDHTATANGRKYTLYSGGTSSGNFDIYDLTASAARLTISSVGNVGIGTNTPNSMLEIYDSKDDGSLVGIRLNNSSSSVTYSNVKMGIEFYNSGSYEGALYADRNSRTYLESGASNKPLILQNNGGNVGIGTTTPSEKLDVNGVALSNYEGFSYYVTGLSVTAGAWVDLLINTLDYNTFPTEPYNQSQGSFTAPRTGFYRFTLTGYSTTPLTTAGDRYAFGIKIEGTLKSFAGGNYSTSDTPLTTYTAVVYLTAGQVVKPAIFSSIVATLGGGTGHEFWFQGEFVGK